MKKRFSSYLLMGKVATLPGLANKAMAANPPSYADLTKSSLSIVPLPAPGVILTTTPYGNNPTICAPNSVPATTSMSVVVTGVMPGDTVYLAASTDSNDPSFLQLDGNLQIGKQNLTIIDSIVNAQSTIKAEALSGTPTTAVKFDVDINKLGSAGFSFADRSQFVMQAVIVPQGALPSSSNYWSLMRYSPLMTVSMDAGYNQYSSCYGY
ncbi:MAG: hypothetical protein JO218_05170 [Burkholderiales bacterium]|nr:hypothetical protein [Burkholderiales bacterium]